jgi:hypothetical protein
VWVRVPHPWFHSRFPQSPASRRLLPPYTASESAYCGSTDDSGRGLSCGHIVCQSPVLLACLQHGLVVSILVVGAIRAGNRNFLLPRVRAAAASQSQTDDRPVPPMLPADRAPQGPRAPTLPLTRAIRQPNTLTPQIRCLIPSTVAKLRQGVSCAK